MSEKYTRNCPKCNKELEYKTISSRNDCEKRKTVCKSCSCKNKKLSDQHKKNIGKGIRNSEKWKKSCVLNPEWRGKISATEKGKIVSDETREKLRISHLGKKPSKKTREKLRETSRKAWQDGKFDKMVQQTISKSSQKFLNRIEDEFGIEFDDREFPLENKFYDAKYKDILIEVDSKWWHSLDEHKKNDKLKNKIAKNNNYRLYRFEVNSEQEVNKVFNQNRNLIENIFKIPKFDLSKATKTVDISMKIEK